MDIDNTVHNPAVSNPAHDTLWTSERTSYHVANAINDRSKVQLFVGTQSVETELIHDGKLFFTAPLDTGTWGVRMYYDGVLQSLDVKSITILGRKGAIDVRPIDDFGTVYPGQTIAIPVSIDLSHSKVNMFIDDQEISIDSFGHELYDGWRTAHVIYFRPPSAGDSRRLVLRVDSAAFVWQPFQVSEHTGKFLGQRSVRQLSISFTGLAATGVVYQNVDTGYIVHPQPTAQGNVMSMPFDEIPTMWKGDSLILEFTRVKQQKVESVSIRLLADKSHNYLSGHFEYTVASATDSSYCFVEIDKAYWRTAGRSYLIDAMDYTVGSVIRQLKYYARTTNGFYRVENYRGGTAGSSISVALDAVR